MNATLTDKISELKEALSKFLLETKDMEYSDQLNAARDSVQDLLDKPHIRLNESEFYDIYQSEDYYGSDY